MRFVRTAENLFSLPLGFTRVEYLESSGSRYYVDTGYKANNTTKVEIKTQGQTWTFGGRTSVAVGDALGICFNANMVALQFGSQSINYNQTGIAQQVSECVISQDGAYINGVLRASFTSETFSCPNNLYLFDINNNGTLNDGLKGKMWYCRIWDGYTLVRDYIPCLDPFGVPCMYDLVGKKPYYNLGTGTFTAGRQVIPVEYLESSGTQYIDTGYKPIPATTKFEFMFTPTSISVNKFLFGARLDTAATSANTCTAYSPNDKVRQDWAGVNANFDLSLNTTDKFLYTAYNNTVSLNNETHTGTITRGTTRSDYNFMLFTVNTGGTIDNRMLPAKLYYSKLWDNGTLVRDFIPCKDENNVGFMFDKVTHTCYLNAGTGDFSVGEPVYTSKLRLIKDAIRIPEGYTRVEYIESTGTQYINTGYIPTNTTGVQVRHTICADNGTDNILFGCRQTSGNNRFWEDVDWGSSDNIGWGFNEYSNNVSGYRCPLTSDMIGQTVISSFNFINDRACKVNGVSYDPSVATKTLATITRPIYLFAANNQGNAGYFNACKIFSCQISEGSTLVRSFIPVRDENNVGYMFDEVTGQLFDNAGSGSFGIGNDLSTPKVRFIQDVLTREYRPLKYLESTGTQYIDTGVYPTQLTEVEYRCAVTGSVSNVDSHLFGSRLSASSQAFDLAYMNTQPNGIEKFRFIHGTTTTQETTTSVTASQLANPHTYYMSGTSFKVDGSEKMSFTTTSFTGSYSLWLFGVNSAGSLHNQVRAQRVYKCIIWDNGVPVRDLYPALRKSDNKPGMYDRITKQFFTNAAQSGNDFNYG